MGQKYSRVVNFKSLHHLHQLKASQQNSLHPTPNTRQCPSATGILGAVSSLVKDRTETGSDSEKSESWRQEDLKPSRTLGDLSMKAKPVCRGRLPRSVTPASVASHSHCDPHEELQFTAQAKCKSAQTKQSSYAYFSCAREP